MPGAASRTSERYAELGENRGRWNFTSLQGGGRSVQSGPAVTFPGRELGPYWGLLTDVSPLSLETDSGPSTLGAIITAPARLNAATSASELDPTYDRLRGILSTSIADWATPVEFGFEEARELWAEGVYDSWIYFRAARWTEPYAPRCNRGEVITGWVQMTMPSPVVHLEGRGRADSCERKEGHIRPLGALALDGRLFAVIQVVGWESVDLGVVDLSPAGPMRLLP